MTLKIRPVKLRQSIYFRVPNDIADLIGIEPDAEVTLSLEQQDDKYLLTYAVGKPPTQLGTSFRKRADQLQRQTPAIVQAD